MIPPQKEIPLVERRRYRGKHAGLGDVGAGSSPRIHHSALLTDIHLLQLLGYPHILDQVFSHVRQHSHQLELQADCPLSMLRSSVLRAVRQMSTMSRTPVEDAMRLKVRSV